MAKQGPAALIDVPLEDVRMPHAVAYDGHENVEIVVVDVGNTYQKAVSMTARQGMVTSCEASAIARPQSVMYGEQSSLTITPVDGSTLKPESFIVGTAALYEPQSMARIGTLQERLDASPSVLRAQILNAIYTVLMKKTQTNRYTATVLVGLEVPLEDYARQATTETVRGIANAIKGQWRVQNGTGVCLIKIIAVVPLPQTLGMIAATCRAANGQPLPDRYQTRYAALDMGGGQIHLGQSTGTSQFSGSLIGQGVTLTANTLIGLANRVGIRLSMHQACHALHTKQALQGGELVTIKELVDEAIELSRPVQVAEAVNALVPVLRGARGLIGGGSSVYYGEGIIAQLPTEYQPFVSIVRQAQMANAIGGYPLVLQHVAAKHRQQGGQ